MMQLMREQYTVQFNTFSSDIFLRYLTGFSFDLRALHDLPRDFYRNWRRDVASYNYLSETYLGKRSRQCNRRSSGTVGFELLMELCRRLSRNQSIEVFELGIDSNFDPFLVFDCHHCPLLKYSLSIAPAKIGIIFNDEQAAACFDILNGNHHDLSNFDLCFNNNIGRLGSTALANLIGNPASIIRNLWL